MAELKIRCDPKTKKRLERVARLKPYLSINAYVNEIILEHLKLVEQPQKGA
jgi:hypothetical protein